METYVVRIYRYETKNPHRIVGILEKVGAAKKRKAFTSYDELWSFLTSMKHGTREAKKGEVSSVASDDLERRNDVRSKTRIRALFPYQGQNVKADIMNVSQKGIGIMIAEKLALSVGKIVDFQMKNRAIRAKVRWVDHDSNSSTTRAGLRTIDHAVSLRELRMAGAS